MKFTHLQPGQRFRWRDRIYAKTGPLTAVAEDDGRTRMIPRSAVVLPADGQTETAATDASSSAPRVMAALDAMTARIEEVASALAPEPATALRAAIEEGRRQFREQVGL